MGAADGGGLERRPRVTGPGLDPSSAHSGPGLLRPDSLAGRAWHRAAIRYVGAIAPTQSTGGCPQGQNHGAHS